MKVRDLRNEVDLQTYTVVRRYATDHGYDVEVPIDNAPDDILDAEICNMHIAYVDVPGVEYLASIVIEVRKDDVD